MTSNGEVNSGWGDQKNTPALWVPGRDHDLSEEYPTPIAEELARLWRGYNPFAEVVDAPGVYGVMTVPDHPPRAYVSVDVCEVLRETHLTLRSIVNPYENYQGDMHPYGVGTIFHESYADKQSVFQVMMSRGLVPPVDGIEKIAAIIQSVHEMGVYVFANTSTLPGCEPGTIEFFKKHVPNGLSGVAFPRNWYGGNRLNKGHVVKNVVERFPGENGKAFIIKIDDTPYHTKDVRLIAGEIEGSEVVTTIPDYPSPYESDEDSIVVPTPLDAFKLMQELLVARLN